MSEFKASGFRDEFGSGGPDLVGITTMTSPYYFVPPSGSTAERPSSPPPGMLRFNTDIGRLEVWRNDHWATILGESPNLGDQNQTNSAGGTGARALTGGRASPSQTNIVDYVSIPTEGNAQDFGDMGGSFYRYARASSRTRGLFAGGQPGSGSQESIEFFTFASTGNATDFGDLLSGGKFGGTGESTYRHLGKSQVQNGEWKFLGRSQGIQGQRYEYVEKGTRTLSVSNRVSGKYVLLSNYSRYI